MCGNNDAAPNCNATVRPTRRSMPCAVGLPSEMTPYVATVYEETKEEAYENFGASTVTTH